MKFTSAINSKYEFSENVWVISLLNTGTGTTGKFTGHSVLLIEGVENGAQYIRQCDIKAAPLDEETEKTLQAPFRNVRGVITDVRIFKNYSPDLEKYKNASARSWYVASEVTKEMLKAVEQDHDRTEKAKQYLAEYIPYEYAGRYSIFGSGADNCPSWCIEKLKIAGVNLTLLPGDKIKTAPQKHVKPGAETAENTLSGASCRIL